MRGRVPPSFVGSNIVCSESDDSVTHHWVGKAEGDSDDDDYDDVDNNDDVDDDEISTDGNAMGHAVRQCYCVDVKSTG